MSDDLVEALDGPTIYVTDADLPIMLVRLHCRNRVSAKADFAAYGVCKFFTSSEAGVEIDPVVVRRAPSTKPTHVEELLSLIGYDRVLVEKFTVAIHKRAQALGEWTPIVETRRGEVFQVALIDDRGVPTGHVVTVSIELDGREPVTNVDGANHG